jgi:hypothetical protein
MCYKGWRLLKYKVILAGEKIMMVGSIEELFVQASIGAVSLGLGAILWNQIDLKDAFPTEAPLAPPVSNKGFPVILEKKSNSVCPLASSDDDDDEFNPDPKKVAERASQRAKIPNIDLERDFENHKKEIAAAEINVAILQQQVRGSHTQHCDGKWVLARPHLSRDDGGIGAEVLLRRLQRSEEEAKKALFKVAQFTALPPSRL